ncbi:CapA family protein [Nocardioides sp.]|uniref:CapA family protein n=1 Tax=Nocardioides sp. TaxID=35761 RepID=UPI002ED0EC0A
MSGRWYAAPRLPVVAALLMSFVLAGSTAGCSGGSAEPASVPSNAPRATTSSDPAGPAPSPPSEEPRPVTRVLVVGDIMLGRGVATPEAPVRPLRFVAGRVRRADIAIGTLESTLSDNGEPQQPGDDSFAAPPGTLAGLERIGFDALSLANNHTGDFGPVAFDETLRAFRGRRIRSFGAGHDLARASRPAVVRRNGVSFGFVGFNAIGETPRAAPGSAGALSVRMPPRTGPLQRADLDHVTGLVRRLSARVDVVIVLPHWGTQYTHAPEPVQSQVGRALVRAGADLVAGGHPHWVQGLEPVGRAVIAHSLGNFVFDMDFMEQTMEGVMLVATFRGDRLAGVRLEPYRMGPDFAPRRVEGAVAEGILADVRSTSRGRFRSP